MCPDSSLHGPSPSQPSTAPRPWLASITGPGELHFLLQKPFVPALRLAWTVLEASAWVPGGVLGSVPRVTLLTPEPHTPVVSRFALSESRPAGRWGEPAALPISPHPFPWSHGGEWSDQVNVEPTGETQCCSDRSLLC